MNRQNGFIKTSILIIIILSIVIVCGVGYFIKNKNSFIKNQQTGVIDNVDSIKETGESKDQLINQDQPSTQPKNNLVDNQPVKTQQDLSYTTKNGIKIYYPSSYVYASMGTKSNAERDACFEYERTIPGLIPDFICPDIPPETLSENITFGFPSKTNMENIIIHTSDFGNFEPDECNYGPNNQSFSQTTIQVGSKTVVHAEQIFGDTEYYCLVTPSYSFVLYRNKNNDTKINVNDIVFP